MRIGIIGAGPGGICTGVRLKGAGYEDFVILEQAQGVGGTWWHNSYPGCACDVPSHLYSFSFATQTDWPQPYGTQPEVRAYLEDCVERFGLKPHIRLETRVESARWDDKTANWHLTTSAGEALAVDVLVGALGLFNLPVYPDIPGLDRFAGTLFHSARWNHDYDLRGKRVAKLINFGSSVKFCRLAEGIADLYPRFGRTMEWDTCAPQALLEAAGGTVCTFEGEVLRYGKPGWENPHFVCTGRG